MCEKQKQSKDEVLLGIKDAHSISVVENDDKGKVHKSGRKSHMILENKKLSERGNVKNDYSL